ncbi:MAG: hypothetical protein EPO65_00440 [Dehalococcoidia bacterium]|nr:MAG: hypothetical protein EPO65_00440 [Dehalococcoidia bacterium]
MDWVKLRTNYWLDVAIVRAGEAAEVLWVRAKAYCGAEENGGFVPRELLPRLTPLRGTARARALVREGLWTVVDGGWQFVDWDQVTREQLEAQREAGRARQTAYRARRNGGSNAVTNTDVTEERREEAEEKAAAAAAAALPASVEILRAALEAHRLHVRWDLLDPDQVADIEALIAIHGDGPLVKSALAQYQPDRPPATAQAWLGGWQQLRRPGDLAAVKPDPCPEPGHSGTTRHCAQCAADRLAGGIR